MISTIMQSKKGTNLECILYVEPAGPADELNVVGKGTRNPEQLQDFWLLQLVLFIETGKREISVYELFLLARCIHLSSDTLLALM